MIIRKKVNRLWAIIGVCALGLYTTACDSGEFPGNEKKESDIELRFVASISGIPTTRAAHGAGVLTGENFENGTHTFGMFVTDGTGEPVVTGSADNMKSILTRGASSDIWSHTDKNGTSLSLKAKLGDEVNITGYYPWISGATATAVPFDLTGDMSTAIDLLYLSSPSTAQQVNEGTPIALTFSHAYSWVTVKLTKLTNDNAVLVKSVTLGNSYDHEESVQKGIMNKGTVDPKTGDVISGTLGSLVITCAPLVDIPYEEPSGTPSEFNFLVPAFISSEIKDSDLLIRITTEENGVLKTLSFPLATVHLNGNMSDGYGFQKGMHNTYNIVYNNSRMLLSLSNWTETSLNEPTMGQGTVAETPVSVNIAATPGLNATTLSYGNHIYHTWLGEVAENNNGEYENINVDLSLALFPNWRAVMQQEPIYPRIMIARNLAAGGGAIPWKDETGALKAKQACVEFRDGGYTDWRLPRIGELFACTYQAPNEIKPHNNDLWSATEYDAETAYSTSNYNSSVTWIFPAKTSKAEALYVRCVRDFDKPKPSLNR